MELQPKEYMQVPVQTIVMERRRDSKHSKGDEVPISIKFMNANNSPESAKIARKGPQVKAEPLLNITTMAEQ